MIQVIVARPAVERALIELLTPVGPVCAGQTDAGSAAAGGAAALLHTPAVSSSSLPASVLPAPSLIVSDQEQPEHSGLMLLLGGDGLALPVRAADIIARVQQALQHQSAAPDALTAREAELLAALAAAAPVAVTRESLLQQVWRYDPHAETHTIETHIYRLRQKLETRDDPRRIVTVPGGYKLEGV